MNQYTVLNRVFKNFYSKMSNSVDRDQKAPTGKFISVQ